MSEACYKEDLLDRLVRLVSVDSPSGFTKDVVALAEKMARELGYATRRTRRGGLCITAEGRDNTRAVACFAHVDTVGLMVRDITEQGDLLITRIGSPVLPSMEGEYCRIHTRDGRVYTGTVLSLSPAYHVYDDAATRPRDEANLYIRLDELAATRAAVRALGIDRGDFVGVDAKPQITSSGFIKSRYLDDKASAAILLTVLKKMKEEGVRPHFRTHIVFTVYEEICQGGAWQPEDMEEFLVVDMGCVGPHLGCTEQMVSICAKDTVGPYDYELTNRLIGLARENKIDYAVDVYPHYSSDAAVAWASGCDAAGALIGPGVHASHGMERTHWRGLANTLALVCAYLELG